ncbi:hypothetical protein B0H10DRAFT_2212941 [Mycena sp. CBHHK59/15]|nr:hypothetical protein B0H10DRAFT_2212941 [Mycena sp. CBHHK59/15]
MVEQRRLSHARGWQLHLWACLQEHFGDGFWQPRPRQRCNFISKPLSTDSAKAPTPVLPPMPELTGHAELPVQTSPKRQLPLHRIMCHVLRTCVEALKVLAAFFEQLRLQSSQSRACGGMHVKASLHLAWLYSRVEVGSNTKLAVRDA